MTSKSVGTGPSSYEKRIYRAAVSQRLRKTGLSFRTKRIESMTKAVLMPYDKARPHSAATILEETFHLKFELPPRDI